MNDREREERAIWKLSEAGYTVRREAGRYMVRSRDTDVTSIDTLENLTELANAIYADHWTGRKITLSA